MRLWVSSLYILRAISIRLGLLIKGASVKQSSERKKNEIKRSESCSIHLGPLKEDSTQIQYHIFHCLLLLNTLRIVKRIIFDKRSNAIRKRGRENETNEKKAIDLLLFRTFYNFIRRLRRTNYKEALFNFPKRGF